MAGIKATTRAGDDGEFGILMVGKNNRNMLFDPRGHHARDIDDMHVAIAQLIDLPSGTRLICIRWVPADGEYRVVDLEKL